MAKAFENREFLPLLEPETTLETGRWNSFSEVTQLVRSSRAEI